MKKIMIVSLLMIAGISQAEQYPACNREKEIVADPKIVGRTREVWELQLKQCLLEANENLAKFEAEKELIEAGYREIAAEKERQAVRWAAEEALQDNARKAAEAKERAKEQAAERKEALLRAEAERKEKKRLASCNPGDPYVGMLASSLRNLCKQVYWSGTNDYGSVVYHWYKTGNARVMVKNGVVSAISWN